MNTEILQQLLSMLEGAGEGSFWLILVYIVYPYFKTLMICGMFSFTAWAFARWLINISYANSVVQQIAATSNDYKAQTDTAPFYDSTKRYVSRWLNKNLSHNE